MKRKTIAIALGALAIAGIGAGLAIADRRAEGRHGWHGRGQMGEMGGRMFGGPITKDQFDTRTRERFARFDKNSDGVIDAGEIEAQMTERMQGRSQMFERFAERRRARLDANRDGKVTKAEFLDRVKQGFAEMDLDNDGKITDADLPPMLRGRNILSGGDAGIGGGRRGRGGPGGEMGGQMGGMGPLGGLLRSADANKDGVITSDEALAAAEKQFARLDKNGDGVIDKADGDATRKEMTDFRVKRFIHHHGADKDGKVTREQFAKKAAERFAMMDANNDGKITRDEMPGGGRMSGRGGERGPSGGRGGMMGQDGGDNRPRRGGPDGGPQGEPPGAPKRP